MDCSFKNTNNLKWQYKMIHYKKFVWSRSVSLILSVSALAWPFVVKNKESVQLNSISILLRQV